MTMQADTFVFYPTFIQQIEAVNDIAVQHRLYVAVAQYGCYGIEPDFSDIDPLGMLNGLFVAIKHAIDDAKGKRREIAAKRSEAGKRGGAPIGNNNAVKQAKTTKINKTSVNVNVDVNDNVNVDDNVNMDKGQKRSPRFVPPSLDEVKRFFEENNFKSDANAFYDYYDANGWTQGNRKPIKKWEAAARQWERRQPEFAGRTQPTKQPQQPTTAPIFDEPDYSDTDFGGRRY